jgi:hypothetical protein
MMRKLWLLSAGVVALSGSMFGDVIWSGSSNLGCSGGCVAVPTTTSFTTSQTTWTGNPVNVTNNQVPFWNNPSSDTINNHVANIGDILAGLTTGTDLIGSNLVGGVGGNINGSYYSNPTTVGNGDPINGVNSTGTITVNGGGSQAVTDSASNLEFSFQSTATAYNISLLFADSSLDTGSTTGVGSTFGYYTEPTAGNYVLTALTAPTDNISGTASSIASADTLEANTVVYGFYDTVCYQASAGVCTYSVTYTTGAGNWSTNASGNPYLGGLGWNHFALFELADGTEVLGFTDNPWGPGNANSTEGIGDFNDIVVALQPPTSTPEPGTIAVMGLGLAGLGLLGRRRFAK